MTGKQTPTQAFIDEIETLRKQVKHLKATSGCQYCNGPLDATPPVGIYECPQCLKNFPDTVSVVEILAQLAAAKERAEQAMVARDNFMTEAYGFRAERDHLRRLLAEVCVATNHRHHGFGIDDEYEAA